MNLLALYLKRGSLICCLSSVTLNQHGNTEELPSFKNMHVDIRSWSMKKAINLNLEEKACEDMSLYWKSVQTRGGRYPLGPTFYERSWVWSLKRQRSLKKSIEENTKHCIFPTIFYHGNEPIFLLM